MFPSDLAKRKEGLERTTFRIWAGVVKPYPFNSSKISSEVRMDFVLRNSVRCLKVFVISSSDNPHLLRRKSVTRPLCGGVVEEGAVREQKLRNVMWGVEVNGSGSGRINWRWEDRLLVNRGFHTFN